MTTSFCPGRMAIGPYVKCSRWQAAPYHWSAWYVACSYGLSASGVHGPAVTGARAFVSGSGGPSARAAGATAAATTSNRTTTRALTASSGSGSNRDSPPNGPFLLFSDQRDITEDAPFTPATGCDADHDALIAASTDAAVRAGWILRTDAIDMTNRVCAAQICWGLSNHLCAACVPPSSPCGNNG